MNKWEPISTAPKNVVSLLLYENGGYYVGGWHNKWSYDSRHPEAEHNGGWVMSGGYVFHPTHWMRLPEPPHD